MAVYFKGFGGLFPEKDHEKGMFLCPRPPIKEFVDPKESRRMSSIVRSGVFSGMTALKNAGVEKPDGIITGTGLGCLSDTIKFINSILQYNEENLNPAPFIYSTHNTVSGQISIITGCKGYNTTFVHRGISFENALFEAFLMVSENLRLNILAGGVDELTEEYIDITRRIGLYQNGVEPGEGSGFFVLCGERKGAVAKLVDIKLVPVTDRKKTEASLIDFLDRNKVVPDKTFILTPFNGDPDHDGWKKKKVLSLNWKGMLSPKQKSGEFMTAGALALVTALEMITEGNADKIFIWNSFLNMESAFILVEHV